MGGDKLAAYQTLYQVLHTITRMIAPFIPFTAEAFYQNLKTNQSGHPESVHLCDYPAGDHKNYQYRDKNLEQKMEMVLRIVNLGRSLRNESAIKIRQPLSEIVIYARHEPMKNLIEGMENLIKDELNVKDIKFTTDYSAIFVKKADPVFKSIGPKFGKFVNRASEMIRAFSDAEIDQIEQQGRFQLIIDDKSTEITKDDIAIRTEHREGYVVATDEEIAIALNITLTESLVNEGVARDIVNRIQNMRKEANFNVMDRIIVCYEGSEKIEKAIASLSDYIKNEVLAEKLVNKIEQHNILKELSINNDKLTVGIKKVS